MQGGHTYKCGHVKHCGDHVQMIQEKYSCYVCRIILPFVNNIEEAKNLTDALMKAKVISKYEIGG